ncbi:MAG: alpha/beta hydrolase, partial [Bacteroidota bacterium]
MKYSVFLICFLMGLNALAQERFIKIDSCKLWVNTIGIENRKVDQPIIVFESGHGTPMDNWDRVLEGAAELAPVIVYDRPGIGKSSPIDEEPTMKNVADRLVRMFNHLELEPPYLLVGHSLGGMYVRGFAIYYPDLLAGLIIIDPADFTENHQNKRVYYDVLGWEEARVDSLINSFIEKRNGRHENAPTSIRMEGQYLEKIRQEEFKEI